MKKEEIIGSLHIIFEANRIKRTGEVCNLQKLEATDTPVLDFG